MIAWLNPLVRRVPVWPVYLVGLVPAVWLVYSLLAGRLGADPAKAMEHALGQDALKFLIATLCVTPLLRLTGLNLVRFRRALGLLAFFYVVAHLGVWLFLDIQLRWSEIGRDIVKRPYITIGLLAFVLLLPLALTSSDRAIRRLGPGAWRRLHLLAYPASFLGAVHYLMVVKAWPLEPFVYLGVVLGLLALRAWWRLGLPALPGSVSAAARKC